MSATQNSFLTEQKKLPGSEQRCPLGPPAAFPTIHSWKQAHLESSLILGESCSRAAPAFSMRPFELPDDPHTTLQLISDQTSPPKPCHTDTFPCSSPLFHDPPLPTTLTLESRSSHCWGQGAAEGCSIIRVDSMGAGCKILIRAGGRGTSMGSPSSPSFHGKQEILVYEQLFSVLPKLLRLWLHFPPTSPRSRLHHTAGPSHQSAPAHSHTSSYFQRKRELDDEILTVAGLCLLLICLQHQAEPWASTTSQGPAWGGGICQGTLLSVPCRVFKHSLPSSLFSGFASHNYLVSFQVSSPLPPPIVQKNTGTPGKTCPNTQGLA